MDEFVLCRLFKVLYGVNAKAVAASKAARKLDVSILAMLRRADQEEFEKRASMSLCIPPNVRHSAEQEPMSLV